MAASTAQDAENAGLRVAGHEALVAGPRVVACESGAKETTANGGLLRLDTKRYGPRTGVLYSMRWNPQASALRA